MKPGDVLSYLEMSVQEGAQLQRGMNFQLNPGYSVLLMSVRPDAPYRDRLEDSGRTLLYEGHDERKTPALDNPKQVDQPLVYPSGRLTQNGLFYQAAERYKAGERPAEHVRVYEKLYSGVWVFNGTFRLTDAWMEFDGQRNVVMFRLEIVDVPPDQPTTAPLEHNRMIPSTVKLAVWQRDGGRCRLCGSTTNLHFDHILPFSKGGTSLLADNIQILCASCNLKKHDKIE